MYEKNTVQFFLIVLNVFHPYTYYFVHLIQIKTILNTVLNLSNYLEKVIFIFHSKSKHILPRLKKKTIKVLIFYEFKKNSFKTLKNTS